MKKLFTKFKNSSVKTKIIAYSLCASLVVGISFGLVSIFSKPEPNESLYGTFRELKELPSTETSYPGLKTYTDGKIPVLTKKSIIMEYEASVRFGVKDITEIEFREDDNKVFLTVPHSEMLGDINIDPDSVKFTSKDRAIFNWKSIEDGPKAMSQARDDAKEDAGKKFNYSQLIEESDENIKDILTSLFGQTGKTVVVQFK